MNQRPGKTKTENLKPQIGILVKYLNHKRLCNEIEAYFTTVLIKLLFVYWVQIHLINSSTRRDWAQQFSKKQEEFHNEQWKI